MKTEQELDQEFDESFVPGEDIEDDDSADLPSSTLSDDDFDLDDKKACRIDDPECESCQ